MSFVVSLQNLWKKIEILNNAEKKPFICRAEYGRFLGLKHIDTSVPDEMKQEQLARSEVAQGSHRMGPLKKGHNWHDKFISVELVMPKYWTSSNRSLGVAESQVIRDLHQR